MKTLLVSKLLLIKHNSLSLQITLARPRKVVNIQVTTPSTYWTTSLSRCFTRCDVDYDALVEEAKASFQNEQLRSGFHWWGNPLRPLMRSIAKTTMPFAKGEMKACFLNTIVFYHDADYIALVDNTFSDQYPK